MLGKKALKIKESKGQVLVRRKVLYIEDEENDVEAVKKYLDPNRFEVVAEISPEKAIGILERDKMYRAIKAVLLDIFFDGKDKGNELAEKIRRVRPEMPIVVLSWEGSIYTVSVDGYFPKKRLFDSVDEFKMLADTLWSAIFKRDVSRCFPICGEQWQKRWGKEYIEFINSPNFVNEEREIGEKADEDVQLIKTGKIKGSYRNYRSGRPLKNVLIARRVISYFANEFCDENGKIHWGTISDLLLEGLNYNEGKKSFQNEEEERGICIPSDNLRHYMHALGIAWGSIINKEGLLEEEKKWLEDKGFQEDS